MLEAGAIVLTTETAAPGIAETAPDAAEVVAVNDGASVDLRAAVGALRERGHGVIVSEAGPTLFGQLVAAALVDELFLTVSPLLAGHALASRLNLVEGVELLPDRRVAGRLRSVRTNDSHLFLRYGAERLAELLVEAVDQLRHLLEPLGDAPEPELAEVLRLDLERLRRASSRRRSTGRAGCRARGG